MADPDSPPPGSAGAPKTFWGHLQDLRKAVIRSVIAFGVALVVCLLSASYLEDILAYPLRHINIFEKAKPTVEFQLGNKTFGPIEVTRDEWGSVLPPGDAPHVSFKVEPTVVPNSNGNITFTLTPDPVASADQSLPVRLHNYAPTEAFLVAFHIALYAAAVLSSPFWIYYLGGFIMPAFHLHERRVIMGWIYWAVALFLTGVLSTYFFLLPVALRASVMYSQWLGFDPDEWQADKYVSFVCNFILGMGLGFQFPLVVLFFVKIGLLTHKQLAHYRRHVVVLALILGMLLTTPEIITQVSMAIPLILLYEICIWIAWYWEWKKRRAGGVIDV
jgi:sec-independent protein translocase protein TatC